MGMSSRKRAYSNMKKYIYLIMIILLASFTYAIDVTDCNFEMNVSGATYNLMNNITCASQSERIKINITEHLSDMVVSGYSQNCIRYYSRLWEMRKRG